MDARAESPWAGVKDLLRRRIGLNPEALPPERVVDGVRQRMAAWHLTDVPSYLELLQVEPGEFAELVELLIVPESWFFRDVQPFRCLTSYVWEHWKPRQPRPPLRVLSVPCCAGEEPYSVAMTLLGLGLVAGEFGVDGVDISHRILQRGRDGTYDAASFRERDDEYVRLRDRFCERTGDRFVVRDEVRTRVRFRQANLVSPGFLAGELPYQVVFCRNLLIYLDAAAREVALANLHRLLEADGLLYVGHVEAAAVTRGPFRLHSPAFPFAFCPHSKRIEDRGSRIEDRGSRIAPKTQEPVVVLPRSSILDPRSSISAARQAADRGNLDEAALQCVRLLQRYPPSAEVFCLLGVIRQAQGDLGEAERCFQRALYLEPRIHEALVHMALLAQRRGDERQAANFRRRAERVGHERN